MFEHKSSHAAFGGVGVVFFVVGALLTETDIRIAKPLVGRKD